MPQPLKLLTIGDSISQGFMSLAAARTDLCYSSIIAREMGWDKNGHQYNIPEWGCQGQPLNLEALFRKLELDIGIRSGDLNALESFLGFRTVLNYIDSVEDYYEREAGCYFKDYDNNINYFHNVAVRGFTISDAWTVSYDLCDKLIKKARGTNKDNQLSLPSASFFRTAARVLSPNPETKPQFNKFTAIDWLKYHARETGVENVFLWLGANNVLATILDMEIRQKPGEFTTITFPES